MTGRKIFLITWTARLYFIVTTMGLKPSLQATHYKVLLSPGEFGKNHV